MWLAVHLLRAWRIRQGLSQMEAAELFAVSQGYYSLLENAKTTPRIDKVIQIARATKGAVPAMAWFESQLPERFLGRSITAKSA